MIIYPVSKGLEQLNLKSRKISFDTETTGLYPYGNFKQLGFYPARPFVFSFSDIDGNSAYVRFPVNPFTREVLYDKKNLDSVKRILEDKKILKIAHNYSFDLRMCQFAGINVQGDFEDTQILAHIVTGGQFLSYALKPFSKAVFDFSDSDEKELEDNVKQNRRSGKNKGWMIATPETQGKKYIKADYWLADDKVLKKYAVGDAERTMIIYLGLIDKLKEDKNIRKVYQREKAVFWVVKEMEELGVKISPRKVKELRKYYSEILSFQKSEMKKAGYGKLNPNSGPQLKKIFFEDKKYKSIKKTDSGLPSTDAQSLEHIANTYDDNLAKCILEYKSASTMLSTFIDVYEKRMIYEAGEYILRPNFLQVGTVTGRFASSDPNLQQVASDSSGKKRSNIVMRIREVFIPREDKVWLLADYSQMEVWVFSLLSGEPSLLEPLLRGEDFHASISKKVWGSKKDYKSNKEYYRKRAKLLMFCRLYGGQAGQVASLLGSTLQEAYTFIDEYNEAIPGVEKYMDRVSAQIHRDGKIINPFGRTYYLSSRFAYKGVNYMVQGTCADIVKRAMIRLHKRFKKDDSGSKLILTIHDELVFEVPKESISKSLIESVVLDMQKDSDILNCPIPLPVTVKISNQRWSESDPQNFVVDEWRERYI